MAKKTKVDEIIFPPMMVEEDHEARLLYLKNTADQVKPDFYYLRKFTQDEINEAKEKLAEVMLELTALEEAFEEKKTEYKEEKKPVETTKKSLIQCLKLKGQFVIDTVFIMHDHESKMAGYYNSKGEVIDVRALRPEEYQKTIKLHENNGTSNE